VALVDESGGRVDGVDAAALARLAKALTIQVRDHLGPAWQTASVTVTADPNPPEPVWTLTLYDQLPNGLLGGFHQRDDLQPYAIVDLSQLGKVWTAVVSHELLEMLVDPWGYRMWWAYAPEDFPERESFPFVPYLVEVCDPCTWSTYTIDVGDGGEPVEVSDFVLPEYFMRPEGFTQEVAGRTSAVSRVPARGVLEGGYLSFRHPKTGDWWLKQQPMGGDLAVAKLPRKLNLEGNLREQIDQYVRSENAARNAPPAPVGGAAAPHK
jgi:hypothetical protein